MIERIAELRAQAEAEIAAARRQRGARGAARALPRAQGRAAADAARRRRSSTPEQRGAVGKAANQARQALEALIERARAQLGGERARATPEADRVDVTLPGAPPQPIGRAAPAQRHAPRAGRHLPRARLHRDGGPGDRDASTTTSTRSTTAPRTRRGRARTPSTSPARTAEPADAGAGRRRAAGALRSSCCARTPRRCRCARWRPTRRRCTS